MIAIERSVIPRLFYQMQCYTYSDVEVNLASIGDISSEDGSTKKGLLFVSVLCSSNFGLCLTHASGLVSVFIYIIAFGRDTFVFRLFPYCFGSFAFLPF